MARVEDGNVEMIESRFEKALMVDARTSTETSGVTAAYFPFLRSKYRELEDSTEAERDELVVEEEQQREDKQ